MPDVIWTAPADVPLWVALDVHKLSIVAGVLPSAGGQPEVTRIETTEKAIGRFIKKRAERRSRFSGCPTIASCTHPMKPGMLTTRCRAEEVSQPAVPPSRYSPVPPSGTR